MGVGGTFLVHERVGADDDAGMRRRDGAELGADIALAAVGAHGFRQHFGAGLELRRHVFEHRLHDLRNAGHDDDIADAKAGRRRDFVEHQLGSGGQPRHAHARLVHHAAGLRQPGAQNLDHAGVIVDRHAERLGDCVGGDVVMGGADAAGGEDISHSARARR